MAKVLVTGASGFLGRHLVPLLCGYGHDVLATSRTRTSFDAGQQIPRDTGSVAWRAISPEAKDAEWLDVLSDVDAVVHLAARVHVMHDTAESSRSDYLAANTDLTKMIAEIAVEQGVRRFIFLSTIKVLGEKTADRPFSPDSNASLRDPYSESKLLAEIELRQICDSSDMEYVIVRPTLVIGEGAGGNLERLVKWINSGVPMPLGGINNRRSLISVETLCEILVRSVENPDVANMTLLAADPDPVSTPEIVQALAGGSGKPARLLSVPPRLLEFFGQLPVVGDSISRLSESLEVDSSETFAKLDWQPTTTILESLHAIGESSRDRA